MPCWPDIWERSKPLLLVAAPLIGYITLVTLLLWAPKVRKHWLRIASRVLGVAVVLPVVVVLPSIVFGLALAIGSPPTETRIVRSSDGQEARVGYDAGFLGRDYTSVALKLAGRCNHIDVLWLSGPSSINNVGVEWLDHHHLRLTYHARPSDQQHCEQRVGEITIECISLRWPH